MRNFDLLNASVQRTVAVIEGLQPSKPQFESTHTMTTDDVRVGRQLFSQPAVIHRSSEGEVVHHPTQFRSSRLGSRFVSIRTPQERYGQICLRQSKDRKLLGEGGQFIPHSSCAQTRSLQGQSVRTEEGARPAPELLK